MAFNYKDAGVNIDAGNDLVEQIKPVVKSTARIGSEGVIGGFGGLFDLKKCGFKDPVLVSATDGVGTKLKIALAINKHNTIGVDLVAMSVNDIVVQGAEPLFFLDYFACSKLEVGVAKEIITGIADGCKQANCALIGGETAEMPGIYQNKDYDLAGFCVGAVERDQILPKLIEEGDVILGLKSSGVHSNGYSMVRFILENKNIGFDEKIFAKNGDERTVGEILLTPTKIYVKSCLAAIKTGKVSGLAHITGGGIVENIPRVLPKNLRAEIDYNSWVRPEIFAWLQKEGNITDEEMHRTFNCGIGMVVICKKADVALISGILQENGEEVYSIGVVANIEA